MRLVDRVAPQGLAGAAHGNRRAFGKLRDLRPGIPLAPFHTDGQMDCHIAFLHRMDEPDAGCIQPPAWIPDGWRQSVPLAHAGVHVAYARNLHRNDRRASGCRTVGAMGTSPHSQRRRLGIRDDTHRMDDMARRLAGIPDGADGVRLVGRRMERQGLASAIRRGR